MVNNFKTLTILLIILNCIDSSNLFSGGTSKNSRHHSKTKEDSAKKLKHSDHSKAKEKWEALCTMLDAPISPKDANGNGESHEKGAALCAEFGDLDGAIDDYFCAIRYYKISKNKSKTILCHEKLIELLNNSPEQEKYSELIRLCKKKLIKLRSQL